MESLSIQAHLSQMATFWTLVCEAHRGSEETMSSARRRLLERYSGVVHRYLLGALRDMDAADELTQEFALRFLRGDFRRADRGRGRFRDYVKTAVFRLVVQHQRRKQKQPLALHAGTAEPAVEPDARESDEAFARSWRDELLARAWDALERDQARSGTPHYTVLRFRADHPELSAQELADEMTRQLAKPISATAMRQLLHRSREHFADLLLAEVWQSLDNPSKELAEEELIDLNLYAYCRPAFERRARGGLDER